jgi:hypothetical protein
MLLTTLCIGVRRANAGFLTPPMMRCAATGSRSSSSSSSSSGARRGGASGIRAEAVAATEVAELEARVKAQGDLVREAKQRVKDGNAEKSEVDSAVGELLALKAKLEEANAPDPDAPKEPTMDEVINVCKRRGFIFQSSEVRPRTPHQPRSGTDVDGRGGRHTHGGPPA